MQGSVGYFDQESCDVSAFKALTAKVLNGADVPHAARVEKNVPIYDMTQLGDALEDDQTRRALMAEWAWVLGQSAGVLVIKNSYRDLAPIDRATDVFRNILIDEAAETEGKGDHFAASGANDRIWNSAQKHCLNDPAGFALYFGNTAVAAACEAWLGPNYQMTAQVNQVRPGGQAQSAHRDYHLGFQSAQMAGMYPIHAHMLTAALTLQGGIAHCDMPVESGPTKLLPFSQLYAPGYLAFHRDDHRDWFEENYVQLPLEKGDAIFFNPALFHAAGENKSADIERLINLLQVSSPFGRAMEALDRPAMCQALLPALIELGETGELTQAEIAAAIAACAEGYAFPTNLDTDPPIGGNAPASQADLLRGAVAQKSDRAAFAATLAELQSRQTP